MKTWLISDTHFGHRNIAAYCGRPTDHEERMWSGLSVVGPEDTLIHLGDVALVRKIDLQRIVDRLPGKMRILVEGNHDKRSKVMNCASWSSVTRYKHILELEHGGVRIAMTHRPEDLAEVKPGSADILIHGHIHEKGKPWRWEGNVLVVNACVEKWDYKPIRLDHIVELHEKWYPGKGSNLQPAD